ncbi:hypothetical protein BJ322DRAFT_1196341 [Thelephora terrestris]|uniref:Ubiquitin-like protease family profile domain-containing protein n=1 Tax=Thelephora terrestris TaxID=56493 RepID=A0A9P6HE40_9AGAM|nr:hypothetical protein BJ322DRAFT_1196341 [Thelephora terrestris]
MATIDLTVKIQFDPSVWIGVKKVFSNSLPNEVYEKKREILKIPEPVRTRLPAPTALVNKFIEHPLPLQSGALSFHQTGEWFSTDAPTTPPEILLTRTVPPERVLKTLDNAFGQKWFDGAASIVDPRFNNGTERFPLWVMSLWKETEKMIQHQKLWRSSVRWLESGTHPENVVAQAKDLINELPWNKSLRLGGTTTLEFAGFLGASWLSDTQINMMIRVLQNRLKTDVDTGKEVLVEPIEFTWELEAVGRGFTDPGSSPYLLRLAEQVQNGVTSIWFPVNVNGCHWIAGKVDFEECTFAFGDSLAASGTAPPPDEVLKGLRKWFNQQFSSKLMNIGNVLQRPRQPDTYSCAICTMSTIGHGIFGDPLWTHQDASVHRIRWLLTLSENEGISIPRDPALEPLTKMCARVDRDDGCNDSGRAGSHSSGTRNVNSSGNDRGGDSDEADGDENLLASEADTPAMSTVSSTASTDAGEDSRPLPYKRKLSLSPFDEIAPARKVSRVSYKQAQSKVTENRHSDVSNIAATDAFQHLEISCKSQKPQYGTSRSAIASRRLREKATSRTYVVQEKRFETWKAKILNLDPSAQFDQKDPMRVFHSRCSTWLRTKEPGDTTRFRQHGEMCRAKPVPAHGTLMGMGWLVKKEARTSGDGKDEGRSEREEGVEDVRKMPCRGASAMDNTLIDRYLKRTWVGGGGGRSIHVVSRERFKKEFRYLTRAQREEVQMTQRAEWRWTNDHINARVHSRKCKLFTSSRSLASSLCVECEALLNLKAFTDAIRKPMPLDENLKFTNTQYLHPDLKHLYTKVKGLRAIIEQTDGSSTPCIKFAEAILSGKIKNKVFNGLLEAMCTDLDKTKRGVGLQNFKYAPAWDELCHIIYIVSPRAYRILRSYFPARTPRSFRHKEAREPRFPMDICDRTFELAKAHLAVLDYHGPVALACDDTKLFAALRLYWDKEKKCYFLVGACSGPICVPDVDAAQEVLRDDKTKKATKIRLWCMTIPVDGVAPILLAVLPISDSEKHHTLVPHLKKILCGLIKEKIEAVSYSCDGTGLERGVQREILNGAGKRLQYKIKSPQRGMPDTTITIPVFNGQPISLLQDSKHALKTLRNNLFSGARLLTLGNYTMLYSTIRDLAFANGSPLERRQGH